MLEAESIYNTDPEPGPYDGEDPWLTMDNNILGTSGSTLEEMLEVDMNFGMDGYFREPLDLELNLMDMPSLEMDNDPMTSRHRNDWLLSSTGLLNGNSSSSTSNFNFDLSLEEATSMMVNPNSVMPCFLHDQSPTSSSISNFTFSPTQDVLEEKVDIEDDVINEFPELDYYHNPENHNDNENNETETEVQENEVAESEDEDEYEEEDEEYKPPASIKAKSFILPTTTIKTISPQIAKSHSAPKMNIGGLKVQKYKIIQSPSQAPHVRKQVHNNNMPAKSNSAVVQTKKDKDGGLSDDEEPMPKPGYSYSCLIAMALKNSVTGNLPVSEIYNFMCKHFPYFRTAPNGWKNSVRHNLSLNKCFEKIEKPAGNGNQRKGCLWAIAPDKIAKMDEEVQKWSRKDPLAIKRAMLYPETLEMLERGELRFAVNNDFSPEESESSSDDTAAESPIYDETVHNHIASNSVTDSYDESSQDCEIDITEHLYDQIDTEDGKKALHMQLKITKQESYEYTITSSNKRQKTLTGTISGNYIYQPVTSSRRKTPLLIRQGPNGSFLKIE